MNRKLWLVTLVLAISGCSSSNGSAFLLGGQVASEPNGQDGLGLPFSGTWYLTGGPHSDGTSNGVRYAVDFAPKEVIGCPDGAPLTSEEVVAVTAGTVTAVDDGTGASNATRSVVEITASDGLTTGYMHLANIGVHAGQQVDRGMPLGNPSCEIPKGGDTSGIHLHFYLERGGQAVAIAGTVLDGWTVQAAADNYQGSLLKNGQTRTADTGRCTVAAPCGSIINEIESGSASGPAGTPPEAPTNLVLHPGAWYQCGPGRCLTETVSWAAASDGTSHVEIFSVSSDPLGELTGDPLGGLGGKPATCATALAFLVEWLKPSSARVHDGPPTYEFDYAVAIATPGATSVQFVYGGNTGYTGVLCGFYARAVNSVGASPLVFAGNDLNQ